MLPEVEIILPCYNPQKDWQKGLQEFYQKAKEFYTVRFIIVNDGSVTGAIPEQVATMQKAGIDVRLISYLRNRGKGFALREGVKAASVEHILYTDIDFPFTAESVLEVLEVLTAGKADVVVGYREENYYQNKMSPFRRILSRSFRYFIKKIIKMPVTDTQCGLKGFNSRGRQSFLRTTIERYLFDFEFIYQVCRTHRLTIQTVPVQLKENVTFSKMKFRILFQEMFNLFVILFQRKKV